MWMMTYYDDLIFVGGGDTMDCLHPPIDNRFSQFYSIQFDRVGTIFFARDHGEKVILRAPVVYFLHPDHHYQYGFVEGERWHHGWLAFVGPRAKRIMERGFMALAPTGYLQVSDPVSFAECFDTLIAHKDSQDPSRHALAVVELERMLGLLIESKEPVVPVDPYALVIHRVVKDIQKNPIFDWDFSEIAKKHSLSYSHFRKLFKQHAHVAPHEFLLRTRMRHAAKRLNQEKLTVKKLADIYGFPDQASFSKLFKKKIGVSPLHYKETLFFSS